jgi:hypothetical protein
MMMMKSPKLRVPQNRQMGSNIQITPKSYDIKITVDMRHHLSSRDPPVQIVG